MINQDKPTPSVSNSTKVSSGETWGSITTTWGTETRTWGSIGRLIVNDTYDKTGLIYLVTELSERLLMESGEELIVSDEGLIVNEDKP